MNEQATNVFRVAARRLTGHTANDELFATEATALLGELGYDGLRESGGAEALRHGGALLELAARLRRVFHLAAPDAPGLVFIGGEVDATAFGLADHETGAVVSGVASLAGCGLDLRAAFEACVGEGAEFLSQLVWGDERIEPTGADVAARFCAAPGAGDLLSRLQSGSGRDEIGWLEGRCLADAVPVWLPVDLCLRRAGTAAGAALGSGCAAGPNLQAATLSALLELVERDAAALWWRGGIRGRPVALERMAAVSALVARLRGERSERRSWLLDITSDIGVPCFAAVSSDDEGKAFASGLSAGIDSNGAMCRALLEMCQMELAFHVVEMKRREGGEAGLNEKDRDLLARRHGITANDCTLLHPTAAANADQPPAMASPGDAIAWIAERLHHRGIEAFVVDLTRSAVAIPVARVLAPGLQPLPGEVMTPRLQAAMKQTGGGDRLTKGVALM